MHTSLRTLRIPLLALALTLATGMQAWAHESPVAPIADLTRRIAAYPDSLPLLLLRGELRRIRGDFEGARADFTRIERRDPARPDLALCRAALELDVADAAAARSLLDASLAGRPGDARALRLRSRALAALGERRAAIADLSAALAAIDRPHPDLFHERARLQVGDGDRAGARLGLNDARVRLGAVASLELYAIELDLADPRPAAAGTRLARLRDPSADPASVAGMSTRIAMAGGGGGSAGNGVPSAPATARLAAPSDLDAATIEVTALPRNSVWRYEATGTDLGTAWRDPSYDDAAWLSGPGILNPDPRVRAGAESCAA